MSGKPSVEGVAEFIACIARLEAADRTIKTLSAEIELRSLDREKQIAQYNLARIEMLTLLERMDLVSNGNAGYEGRISWFFAQLARQLRPLGEKSG